MASTITKDQLQRICTDEKGATDYKLVDSLYELFYTQSIPISFKGKVAAMNSGSIRFDNTAKKIYLDINLGGVIQSFQLQTV